MCHRSVVLLALALACAALSDPTPSASPSPLKPPMASPLPPPQTLAQCLLKCQKKYFRNETTVTKSFCGTDNVTHTITWYSTPTPPLDPFMGSYLNISTCYFKHCNLSSINPGSCECPSDCYASLGQGQCVNSACQCAPGWRGRDCSLPQCPQNLCSGHGVCDPLSNQCVCDPGWTSALCLTPSNNLSALPYGEFSSDKYYTTRDPYGDDHPVFNLSVIATLKVAMDPKDLLALLKPLNANTDLWRSVTLRFSNGNVDQIYTQVGMRVRGKKGRTMMKRGFRFSFTQFGNDNRLFYGVSSINMVSEWEDPAQMNQFIARDFYRAMGVHGSRMSLAALYVNEVYFGIYTLEEEFDKTWIEDSWKKHKGNFYKICCDQWLSQTTKPTHGVEIREGDATNWTEWRTFYTKLNSPNITEAELSAMVNVDLYGRNAVVEIFVVQGDGGILNGNNYGFYHNPHTSLMDVVSFDWESTLHIGLTRGVFEDFYLGTGKPTPTLFKRFLSFPSNRQAYIALFKEFLTRVFSAAGQKVLQNRIAALGSAVVQQVARDANYNLQGDRTAQVAQKWVNNMHGYVLKRAQACAQKLNMTSSVAL